MLFFKRGIIGLAALGFIFLGGSGTQSGSLLAQGGGFLGLMLGTIVLYIFFKMAWRAMGCLPSFILFSIVVFFILYAIGALNNGASNLVPNIKNFLGGSKQSTSSPAVPDLTMVNSDDDVLSEEDIMPAIEDEEFDGFVEYGADTEEEDDDDKPKNGGINLSEEFANIMNNVSSQPKNRASEQMQQPSSPVESYPMVHGLPRVVNGDTVTIQGGYLRLYGVDAPEANQTCADNRGRSYRCGSKAAEWLKGWITGHTIECRIVKRDAKGNMLGTCSIGEYDIGAALVNAGWAVADIRTTDIYVPYQKQAKMNRRGLWKGKFYMPWDWRKLQTRKAKIKVIKPKDSRKSMFDF